MIELIRALSGAVGITQNNLDYTHTPWSDFVQNISPCSIGLTSQFSPSFFNGGTRARTASPWDHTFIYAGKSAGEMIRDKFPELLGERTLYIKGSQGQEQRIKLKNIPAKPVKHEIIESGPLVEINPLEKKYKRDDTALELWSRPMTPYEIEGVLFNAYLMHGMPYDVAEIANYILPIPNTTLENTEMRIITSEGIYETTLVCCSTLAVFAFWMFHNIELLCRPGKYGDLSGNWQRTPPSEIHKYMLWSNKGWIRRLRNCVAGK